MDRTQQRLSVETSKQALNVDQFIKIQIDGKECLLPSDEINKVVSVAEQFNKERQDSNFYRIIGTINPAISNPLFNLEDSAYADLYTWKGFNFVDPVTNKARFGSIIYPTVIKTELKEVNGWFGYYYKETAKIGLCNFIEMEPKHQRLSFVQDVNPYHSTNSNITNNWYLTITYPHHVDSGHTMVNNGLLIVEAIPATVSTRVMTAFGMPCYHNLSVGDIVRITGTNGYNGDFVVVRTGLDNGDLKDYYFVVDIPPTGVVSNNSRIKRVVNGIESTYYFRIFRKVKTRTNDIIEKDDFEIYKLAFSNNVYNDDIVQFVFNEDIDVTNLKDNLGRPLSELYLTIVKSDSNGLFGNVSSGIETPFIAELNNSNIKTYLLDIPVINKIHNGVNNPFVSHVPLETSVTIDNNNNILGNNDFYGDLVEYNKNEVKETVLIDVSHRFNTKNRESQASMTYTVNEANSLLGTPATTVTVDLGPRQEGYFYKAHHLIKIREFSVYVEQGDDFTVGMPDYAIRLDDGRYLWRDMLEIGYNQTNDKPLDYPFLNGCHYLYDNYCFHLRRQDPFDIWNLYYSNFPSDPLGSSITNNFDVNSSEDVC